MLLETPIGDAVRDSLKAMGHQVEDPPAGKPQMFGGGQAIGKLDGVSVHLLRFGAAGVPDEGAVNAIRDAYHLRGWKHLVTTSEKGGPVKNGTTDVWMVMDGINVRGAVILAETPKSVTLVTVAGNLSPIDILHLRGHFGIPKIDGDDVHADSR